MKYRFALAVALFWAGILFGLSLAQPAVYAAPASETPNPSPVGPPRIAVAMRAVGQVMGPMESYGPVILGIMDRYNPKLDQGTRQEIMLEILAAAEKWSLDPLLIAAVIAAESSYRPRAESHCGARGLMQITAWHKWRCPDRYDIAGNIDTGCWYLSVQLERFGFERVALAAYNAGPKRARWAQTNIPETRHYIRRVLRIRDELAQAQTAGNMAGRYQLASGGRDVPVEFFMDLTLAIVRSRKGVGA